MEALTSRQREILDYISASISERGFPPTLREIGEHFGIRSTNGVNDHLKALEKKGVLRREDLKSRAMRPVMSAFHNLPGLPGGATAAGTAEIPAVTGLGGPEGDDVDNVVPFARKARARVGGSNVEVVSESDDDLASIPILGRVAAGQPILALEHIEDTVRVDRVLLGGHREVFGLRIVGESMIEAGIFDGDYVFVKKTAAARPGEIVVAMIDGEATVKSYFPEGDHIRFQPANSNMAPIIVLKSEVRSVDILGIVVGVYRKI